MSKHWLHGRKGHWSSVDVAWALNGRGPIQIDVRWSWNKAGTIEVATLKVLIGINTK